jgi:GTP pyrophosphokinase/guanosine-3',5'-bis(diphosphate) 3'-pyrophosphohydrolase
MGAKIDGIRSPLWTRLRNGQSVEIITAVGQTPEAKWLEMTATGKARDAIKHALKSANKDRYALLGQELARVAFEHIGKKATDQALSIAAQKLSMKDARQVVEMLGASQIEAHDVVNAVYPDLQPSKAVQVSKKNAVLGLRHGQSFTRALCCAPLPGERIVGIKEPERGVFVHTVDCMSLAQYEEDEDIKWIDVQWHSGTHPAEYSVPLELTINNDAGVLGKVCALVAEQGANISNLEFLDRKTDFYKLRLEVDLQDIKQLHTLLSALKAETDVALVSRLRDPSLLETSEAEF